MPQQPTSLDTPLVDKVLDLVFLNYGALGEVTSDLISSMDHVKLQMLDAALERVFVLLPKPEMVCSEMSTDSLLASQLDQIES